LAAGVATGSVLSIMLIRVLSGVFDPPPDTVAVPWLYLVTLASATAAALVVVATSAVVLARRPAISALREAS
jgi:putative ABC transport system permease protein